MPLHKQSVGIDFTGGLDTKTDKRLVLPGKLTKLENGTFGARNTISKRGGTARLGNETVFGTGAELTSAQRLESHAGELLVTSGGNLYAHSNQGLVSKGTVGTFAATMKEIVRNPNSQKNFDAASAEGLEVYVWEDTRGGIRASVFDSSGVALLADSELSATGVLPRVVTMATGFGVYYVSGANLCLRIVRFTAPATFLAEVVLATDVHATPKMDADSRWGWSYVAYRKNAATISVFRVTDSGVVDKTYTWPKDPDHLAIACGFDTSATTGTLVLVIQNSTVAPTRSEYLSLRQDFAAVYGTSKSGADDLGNSYALSLDGSATEGVVFLSNYSPSSASYFQVRKATITFSGSSLTVSNSVTVADKTALASRCIRHNGIVHVAVKSTDQLQPTTFIITENGSVEGRISGGVNGDSRLPSVIAQADGFFLPVTQHGRLFSYQGTLAVARGIAKASFITSRPLQSIAAAKLQFRCSAIPGWYDGDGETEAGFHLMPSIALSSTGTATGAGLSVGDYYYICVFEWTDAKGIRHQSAPSVPRKHIVTTTGRSATMHFSLPTLTERKSPRSSLAYALYRTEVYGTIFYRVSNPESPVTSTCTDEITDADLISHEPLYTTGGVIEAGPVPACEFGCIHQNRVVVGGLEDPDLISYSTELEEMDAPRFHEDFRLRIPAGGGRMTALASLEDRLMVFREKRIWAFSGSGPNKLGLNASWSDPYELSADIGCNDWRSLAKTPDGLMFQSGKGFYLLSRGGALNYIGAPVEEFNALTIVGTVVREDENQARFYSSEGTVLVYDWFWRQWSVHISLTASSVVAHEGSIIRAKSDGTLWTDETGTNDAGSGIPLTAETAWIKVAGVQGYQRVWRLLIAGEFQSACTLAVDVGYDYGDDWEQYTTFDIASQVGTQLVQEELHLAKQKCQALRVRVRDLGSVGGAGVILTNLTLEVGIKPGAARLPRG